MRFHVFSATAVVVALLALSSASAGTLTTNVAYSGNGGVGYSYAPGSLQYTPGNLNNQITSGQDDTAGTGGGAGGGYQAVIFSGMENVNQLFFEQYGGYVQNAFNLQVSYVSNPVASNNADWTTVQSYSGVGAGGQNYYGIPGSSLTGPISGMRMETTNNSNTDGQTRGVQFWAFTNYNNLATSATISSPGSWAGSLSTLNNQQIGVSQVYTSLASTPTIELTWGTAQRIGAIAINGGSGPDTTYPTSYNINYWNGSAWVLADAVTGNTNQYALTDLGMLTTTQLQIVFTGDTAGDNLVRLSQILVFSSVPEPGSVTLALFGVVGVWLLAHHHRRSVKK